MLNEGERNKIMTKTKDIKEFINFIIELVEEDIFFYDNPEMNAWYYFMHGGCYMLFKIINHYLPETKCMVKKTLDHCAIYYNGLLYDASFEQLDINEYYLANDIDFEYMEENFGPIENRLSAEQYIEEIAKCNVKGILY